MAATTRCVVCHRQVDLPDGAPPDEPYRCPRCVAVVAEPAPAATYTADRSLKTLDDTDIDRAEDAALRADAMKKLWRGAGWQMRAHLIYLVGLIPLTISSLVRVLSDLSDRRGSLLMTEAVVVDFLYFNIMCTALTTWILSILAAREWLTVSWRYGGSRAAIPFVLLNILMLPLLGRYGNMFKELSETYVAAGLRIEIPVIQFLEGERLTMLSVLLWLSARSLGKRPVAAASDVLFLFAPSLTVTPFLFIAVVYPSRFTSWAWPIARCLYLLGLVGVVCWGLAMLASLRRASRPEILYRV